MNTTDTRYSVGFTLLAGLPLFTLLPLGLDIFLPAVYQISEFFGQQSDQPNIPALAISIYMLFWGLGQLFWGGMADTIGKKTTALLGLVIFTTSAYLISQVETDDSGRFLALRALQSFGGSACFTAIFALIRIRFEGAALNKAYSYLNGILAFIPVSAPLIGAYIVETNSWLTLFSLMAALGLVSLGWIAFALPKEPTVDNHATATDHLLQRYLTVLTNTRFRTYLFFALVAQTLFIYLLTVAPMYLMGKLGLSQVAFGQMFMVIALVFMLVSFLAPKINQLMTISTLVGLALLFCTLGGVLMFALSGITAWYALIVPMGIIAVGCTLLLSSCPANALAECKSNAGIASGLYTATTFGAGALISALFSQIADSTDLSEVAMVYTLTAAMALLSFAVIKTTKSPSLSAAH